jgi:hypothetical protein
VPVERWSVAQVVALAPDPGSVKGARAAGAAAGWVSVGLAGAVLWGECRGSGRTPYQVAVDLAGPAYRCSCPSRKIPCKHALGLLLRWAENGVDDAAAPGWVAEWAAKRAANAAPKAAPTPDPVAAAKRAAQRADRVATGLQELGRWLDDQVRHGLAGAERAGHRPFEAMAARLVDAQAPTVAGAVRRLGTIPGVGAHWADRLLAELALLRLLTTGYARLAELPPGLAATVRSRIGFPVSTEDVLAGPAVRDSWQVLGHIEVADETLTTRRTWLRGAASGRFALLLAFAPAGRGLPADLIAGTELDADLHHYPGALPLRALLGTRHGASTPLPAAAGTSVAEALAWRAAALAAEPWRETVPVVLADVAPTADGLLADPAGDALPLVTGTPWWLLAAAGGHPATVVAELGRDGLRPLAAWAEGRYVAAPAELPRRAPGAAELPPELLSAALVGTDRRPWAGGPLDVGRPLDPGAGGTPAALLEAAAVALAYHRAGQVPSTGHPPLPPAAAETARPLPAAAATRLGRLLADGGVPGGGHVQQEILAEWLAAVPDDRYVPAQALPALLDAGRRSTAVRHDLGRVAGRRGPWLAAQSPDWRYLLDEASAAAAESDDGWHTGTVGDRVAYLQRLRRRDPAAGLALLAESFPGENAHDRARFVEALAVGLSLADDEFLDGVLDDRRKEVRQAAADLLRTLPGSGLQQRMAARVSAWVQPDRRMLGRDRIVVTPPDTVEPYVRRDGIEPRGPRGTGPVPQMVEDVIGAAPLALWTGMFRRRPADIVAMPVDGNWSPVLLRGLAVAAVRESSNEWGAALAPAFVGRDGHAVDRPLLWQLLALVPAGQLAELAAEELRRDTSRGTDFLAAYRGPWPDGLDDAVLRVVEGRARGTDHGWQLGQLCRQVSATMPPAAYTKVGALADQLVRDGVGEDRVRPITALAAVLTFRHDMLEELR